MSSTATTPDLHSRGTASARTPSYPPGPKSRVFGLDLYRASQRDPLGFMSRIARDHGDIVHFKIGQRHVYQLNHPDYIKGVLSSHYANFLKGRGIVRRDNFLGEGLLTSEGSFHRRQRESTGPAFDRARLAGYGETMTRLAADASDSWREGDPFDVLEAMRRITLPIASQTLFGTSVETEHERIIAAIRTGLSRFSSFKPASARLVHRISFLHRRRLRVARVDLEGIVSRIIEERRRTKKDHADLLSILLSRTADDDERLASDRQVRDEAITLFIGGFENIATTLTWTWYLLALHPEIQGALYRELDSVLSGRLPTASDLPRLSYTRMILDESMRIYPPVPRLRAHHPGRLSGRRLHPAGRRHGCRQPVPHASRPALLPVARALRPERWTPEARAARPPYSFFPFGGGPRRCIGEGFGRMEGVLVLATLASRWRLSLTSPNPVAMRATHFLHPKEPLTMTATRRTPLRD